jgi:hypothetical protein
MISIVQAKKRPKTPLKGLFFAKIDLFETNNNSPGPKNGYLWQNVFF